MATALMFALAVILLGAIIWVGDAVAGGIESALGEKPLRDRDGSVHGRAGVLRLEGQPGAANRHTFVAIRIGEGQLTLAPAGPEARSIGLFTVRIQVVRDTVQPPQP